MTTSTKIERSEEEQRKRPINRLQTVYALRAQQDEDYKNMQDAAQAKEKPVAWCAPAPGTSYYRHVFKAMNIDDIYTDGYGPVIAAAGSAPFFLDRCTSEGFPEHMCGYYLVMIGYLIRMMELGGKIPPEAPPRREINKPDIIVSELRTCDNHSKGMQAMGQFTNAPMWIEESGPEQNISKHMLEKENFERDVKMLSAELKEFILWLERLLGKKMDWDKFEQDITANDKMWEIWSWISNESRKIRPCPVNIRDHLTAITGALFKTPNLDKSTQLFGNMRDEVQYRIDNKIAGINRPEKYRVNLGSIPPWHSLNIFEQLADRGWNFVRGGYNAYRVVDVSWVKDPVEKAVRYWYPFIGDQIDEDFTPEEAKRVKKQIREQGFSNEYNAHDAKLYKCDGVFLHPLRTCRPVALRVMLQQYQVMEAYKVPSIVIPGDHIDPRVWDPEDAMKKFIAFEETMDYYKEVRKKVGFDW